MRLVGVFCEGDTEKVTRSLDPGGSAVAHVSAFLSGVGTTAILLRQIGASAVAERRYPYEVGMAGHGDLQRATSDTPSGGRSRTSCACW